METQPELLISPVCEVRGTDVHGSGHYGASRGSRTHKGVDLVCVGGTIIKSPVDGVITRCRGIVYSDPDKQEWRYVEVTDKRKNKHRIFYVQELDIELGLKVIRGDCVGVAQGVEVLYPGITPHVHYEIKGGRALYFDPLKYLKGLDNGNSRAAARYR